MRCLVRLSNSVCFGVCWLHVWLDGRGIGFLLEWIVSKAIGIQRYQWGIRVIVILAIGCNNALYDVGCFLAWLLSPNGGWSKLTNMFPLGHWRTVQTHDFMARPVRLRGPPGRFANADSLLVNPKNDGHLQPSHVKRGNSRGCIFLEMSSPFSVYHSPHQSTLTLVILPSFWTYPIKFYMNSE